MKNKNDVQSRRLATLKRKYGDDYLKTIGSRGGVRSRELEVNKGSNKMHSTHNQTGSPEHDTWCNIKQRCYDTNCPGYARYGARGIKMCARWKRSFENFLRDMGNKPSPKHSIDRIDNEGNYSPENCRWATAKEQANNKSTNLQVDYGGEKRTVSELADLSGLPYAAVHKRVMLGWSGDKIVETPSKKAVREAYLAGLANLAEAAKKEIKENPDLHLDYVIDEAKRKLGGLDG